MTGRHVSGTVTKVPGTNVHNHNYLMKFCWDVDDVSRADGTVRRWCHFEVIVNVKFGWFFWCDEDFWGWWAVVSREITSDFVVEKYIMPPKTRGNHQGAIILDFWIFVITQTSIPQPSLNHSWATVAAGCNHHSLLLTQPTWRDCQTPLNLHSTHWMLNQFEAPKNSSPLAFVELL
jgi:hypothetical protein